MAAAKSRKRNMVLDESQIFAPFRAVGFVSNHVPLHLQIQGSTHLVTTVVGNSYHTYNCEKLTLQFVGQALEKSITAVASTKDSIVVSSGCTVTLYIRGKKFATYKEHTAEVNYLLVLGDHVISVDSENCVKIWSHRNLETYLTLDSIDKKTFEITTCVHPSTYLNKIIFGSKQGTMQLWNICTNEKIYEFQMCKEAITILEQAPAVDVIAIGLRSGKIILQNIKYDEMLMSFYQEFGLVTAISFRTDGPPIMATGSPAGHISFWDLDKKQSLFILREAHIGSVTGMKFPVKQPTMITSGPDNSLKIWIFDNPDGSARLLKSRSGHSAPPNRSIFYGSYGNAVLTSGMDQTLRYTSIMRGVLCLEFSQGSLMKKAKLTGVLIEDLRLPTITCIAAEPTKEHDWDNIITCHLGFPQAITWSAGKRSIGKHRIGKKYQLENKIPTAVDISSCGNFCVIGYNNGSIKRYNMQSGLERADYGKEETKHTGAVRGLSIDCANLMVVSASADLTIKFWNFKDGNLINSCKCTCPITQSKLHRESSLLAVCFDDFMIQIFDIETKKMVRQFSGHANVITDMSWSSDARWLISSSMDGSIKTWDIPSSRLIDCFLVDAPATSVSYSPSGEYLVTTHQDNVGIYLWSNKVTYSGVYPTPLTNDYVPAAISLPTTQIEGGELEERVEEETSILNDETSDEYKSPLQLEQSLLTLSMLPESRWKSLVNLDLIKARNKPKDPPKKPKAAPFFLPTVAGLETKFDLPIKDDSRDEEANSKHKLLTKFTVDSPIQTFLINIKEQDQGEKLLEKLKTLSPAETDVEFRILSPDAGGDKSFLLSMMEFFIQILKSGKDYELIHAYISLFLKLHGDMIYSDNDFHTIADTLWNTIRETWSDSEELLNQSICLVKYFKSATV